MDGGALTRHEPVGSRPRRREPSAAPAFAGATDRARRALTPPGGRGERGARRSQGVAGWGARRRRAGIIDRRSRLAEDRDELAAAEADRGRDAEDDRGELPREVVGVDDELDLAVLVAEAV